MELREALHLWQPAPGWLNTATYGLPPSTSLEAMERALDEWRRGTGSIGDWDRSTDRSRAAFARLVGAGVDDIAIGAAVSQLLAPVAAALPPGAHVVVPDIEFTSNLFPWLVRDLKVTTAPPGELANAIERNTAAVAFSVVQSSTGEIARLDDVIEAARANDALVIGDATQALGWLPVDATRFDVLACSAYKWLMAPKGTSFAYLSPAVRDRIPPLVAGWYAGEDESYYGLPLRLRTSARRFDLSPGWMSYIGAAPTLELLNDIGVEAVHRHDVALADRFRAGMGLPPGDSAIVSVETPGAAEKLAAAGVRAAVRDGRLRASFHLYTTEADVDMALDALTG